MSLSKEDQLAIYSFASTDGAAIRRVPEGRQRSAIGKRSGGSGRFDRSGLFLKYTVDLGERQSSREAWLKSMASKVATASLTKDRKWEADWLVNEIGLAPDGLVLAVACPVLFEDEKHRCIAEIDGVFVRVDDCQLDVTFLEAKNRGKRATTLAKQDLEEKLKTLKLHQAIPNVCKREGYAAVTLSFGP